MSTAIRATGPIISAIVDGREVDLDSYAPADDGDMNLIYANVPPGGWELRLSVRSNAPIVIKVEESTDGLPAVPGMTILARPADTMPSPLYARDATVIKRSFSI
jgi:hypothetical protein